MGVFSDIKNAKPGSGGVYFLSGVYDVEILRVRQGETRKGVGNFIVELKILASTNAQRPVGQFVTWYQGLDKEGVLGRIKGFFMAAGASEEEITESFVDEMTSEDNPLAGTKLHASVTDFTSKAGRLVQNVQWEPLS